MRKKVKVNEENLEKYVIEFLDNYNSYYLTKKDGYYEIDYDKQDYEDYLSEETIKKILEGKTKEERYDRFYETIYEVFSDNENEIIWNLTSEFENEYDYVSHDTEIQDILVNLIVFNYDTFLDDSYSVNLIIDFNNQDSNTEFSNSSNLDNCRNNNLYTLLRKQGYTKKDYLENLKNGVYDDYGYIKYKESIENGCNKFLTSVKEEIENNSYECLTTLVVLKELTLKELIENDKFIVNTDNMIGLFNECYGSGSLLEIKLEKDFILDRENDIFKIQVEYTKQNFGYTVNEVYGLVSSCWK